jgi:hypothetical protein
MNGQRSLAFTASASKQESGKARRRGGRGMCRIVGCRFSGLQCLSQALQSGMEEES